MENASISSNGNDVDYPFPVGTSCSIRGNNEDPCIITGYEDRKSDNGKFLVLILDKMGKVEIIDENLLDGEYNENARDICGHYWAKRISDTQEFDWEIIELIETDYNYFCIVSCEYSGFIRHPAPDDDDRIDLDEVNIRWGARIEYPN